MYSVSEALQGAKIKYTELEKLAYALLMASRKLRHYFLVHAIIVPMSYPRALMLQNKVASGRIGKWAAKLAPFDLTFAARMTIKSQDLADFIAEWTPQSEEPPNRVEAPWTIYTDGSWCTVRVREVAILIISDGQSMSHATRFDFATTNNASEYEALLLGLRKAKALRAKCIVVKSDSCLMAGHFNKSFTARDPEMAKYPTAVRVAARHFRSITVQTIPRGSNEAADRLTKLSNSDERPPLEVFYEILWVPSVAPEAQGVVHLVIHIDGAD